MSHAGLLSTAGFDPVGEDDTVLEELGLEVAKILLYDELLERSGLSGRDWIDDDGAKTVEDEGEG